MSRFLKFTLLFIVLFIIVIAIVALFGATISIAFFSMLGLRIDPELLWIVLIPLIPLTLIGAFALPISLIVNDKGSPVEQADTRTESSHEKELGL